MQIDLNILAEEEHLLQLANPEMQHIQAINAIPEPEEVNPENLLDMDEDDNINIDDINLDDLVGPGEEGFSNGV